MPNLKEKFSEYYFAIKNSIGFFPTIIALFFIVMAAVFLTIDYTAIGLELKKEYSWLDIKNPETARIILSTLITGIISLMALSFSMVMIVLNQATTSLSPKVVLGLTSQKSHQVVLGVYLGTVVYSLIILLTVRNYEGYYTPAISVLVAIMFTVLCLVFFVYFIHKTSQSIQVNNVIERIHLETRLQLKTDMKKNFTNDGLAEEHDLDDVDNPFYSRKSGYLQEIDVEDLVKIAQENGLVFKMEANLTDYVLENLPIAYTNKNIDNIPDKVKKQIYDQFIFYSGEKIDQNFRYGFTQLMEIAIKALSPSINDPGRAVVCLNYLTDLFSILYFYQERNVYRDKDDKIRLVLKKLEYDFLFNSCYTPIRQYGGGDISIVRSMLLNIKKLSYQDRYVKLHRKMYQDHIEGLLVQVNKNIFNNSDIRAINDIITNFNDLTNDYYNFDLIKGNDEDK